MLISGRAQRLFASAISIICVAVVGYSSSAQNFCDISSRSILSMSDADQIDTGVSVVQRRSTFGEMRDLFGPHAMTRGYSSEEIDLLARVISAEARGEPYDGQVAVGAVILNRIDHPSFPDSLEAVCYQPGAFSCISAGYANREPTQSCKNAAADALMGADPSGGAIYFYNPALVRDDWILSRPVIKTIGNHRFCG